MKAVIKENIIWQLVIVYLLQCYLLPYQVFFMLSLGILLWECIKSHFRVPVVRIPELNAYIFLLIFITMVGFIRYPLRFAARDVYYEFGNIIIVLIGYFMYSREHGFKRIYTTIFFMAGLVSMITVLMGIANIITGNVSFAIFRESFSVGIKSLEFLIPIYTIWIFWYDKMLISRKVDRIIIAFWAIQVFANLSRTTLIAIFFCYAMTVCCLSYTHKIDVKKVKRALLMCLGICVIIIVAIKMMPGDVLSHFFDKFARSFTEVSSKNTFTSLAEANNNWRGYEISRAIEQWKESSFMEQIFGAGNGTLIGINFVPDLWNEILETVNGITGVTVLHNSYYTLLIKGGVLTVTVFCLVFVLGIKRGYSYLRRARTEEEILLSLSLVFLCVTMMIDAYITRGMVQNDIQFIWSILFGWINAKMIKYKEIIR